MIRTVTLNTGFDELFTVSALEFGGVSDLREHRTFASGKGINAARTIAALGEPVKAYGLIGKTDRDLFLLAAVRNGVIPAVRKGGVFPCRGSAAGVGVGEVGDVVGS